jgi:hypothetical protein
MEKGKTRKFSFEVVVFANDILCTVISATDTTHFLQDFTVADF